MNGIPNGFGPSGIETKLLTHRYLEQKSYYISSHLTKSPLQGLIALDTTWHGYVVPPIGKMQLHTQKDVE